MQATMAGARRDRSAPRVQRRVGQIQNGAEQNLKGREAPMSEYNFGRRDGSQERKARGHSDDRIQYLWSAEERLLQLISTHTPLPKLLNEICSALDCQIGNVVSLISLPGGDDSELAAIAMNATLFGLHTFCSEEIVAEKNCSDFWRCIAACRDPRPAVNPNSLNARSAWLLSRLELTRRPAGRADVARAEIGRFAEARLSGPLP
jgi:hypothetical protein